MLTVVAVAFVLGIQPAGARSSFDGFGAGPMPSVVSAAWGEWIHDEVAARLAAFAFARDVTRYVSLDGDDDGDGMTPGTAWRSVAKGAAFLAAPGGSETRELLLRRGDDFRAEMGIIATRAGTRIADYGDLSLPKPRLSGFALVFAPDDDGVARGWEADSAFADGRVASRVVDSVVRWVRQGGDADFDSPLARMASAAGTIATPGSWHFDAAASRLWVHTRDGTPVAANLIEGATATGNGIRIAGDLSIVENVEAIGWGLDTLQQDPIQSRASGGARTAVVGCDAFYCFSHAISHWTGSSGGSLTVVGCTAGFTSFNPAGETIFNGFAQSGGNDLLIHHSAAVRGSLPSVENMLDGGRARAWYAHATGSFLVGRVVVHGFHIPAHPFGCRDLGHVANAPGATTIGQAGALAVGVVGDGLRSGALLAARNALVNSRLRFAPLDHPSRALQGFGASGWMINSSIHIDLAAVTQGPRFALYNGTTSNNAPKIWFSEIRVSGTRPGLDMVIDYDGANASPNASLLSSVFVRESDGGAFNANVGGSSTVLANAYRAVTPHISDGAAVILADVQPWGEPPGPSSPLVGAAVQTPVTLEIDQTLALRATDTIGPFEPVGASCPADLDGDGMVGPTDLGVLLVAWGAGGPADLDGDGIVGAGDLGLLLTAWGECLLE